MVLGTTNPTKNLEVNGQTRLSGTVEMEKVLLKKLEELTLYMIQMKESNDKLQKEVDALKAELKK